MTDRTHRLRFFLSGRAWLAAFVIFPASGLGCAGDDARPSEPAPFAPDVTVEAGPFGVEPGEDLVMCSYVRAENDAEADVTHFRTKLGEAGHHLIVYAVDHAIDLPPGACPIGGQPGWRQLLVTQSPSEERALPSGIGYRIKPRQQLVLETHHVNTSPSAIEATGALELAFAEEGEVTTLANTYIIGTINIDVPPNAAGTKRAECALPIDMSFLTMFGHQHRYGTGVAVELLPKGGGEGEELYKTDQWEAPPVAELGRGRAAAMGDTLAVNCEWENTSGESLRYPREMCYAIGLYWPSAGSLFCASGGGDDACGCSFTGTFDAGSGGAKALIEVSRKDAIAGTVGDPASGAPVYCFVFREEDWVDGGPKEGTGPYYVGEALDVPLSSESDKAVVAFEDVTPGAYAVTCMMDTIGGGFIAGKGALVNAAAGTFTAAKGEAVKTSVVLDFAIP